jgi:carbon-monoxide dehydrogenase medium subunit
MYDTILHRPETLAEAKSLFGKASDGRYLAGGQTLIPTMKQRLAAPTDVISLTRIAELRGISADRGAVVIGAGTTHYEVSQSEAVRSAIPALAELAGSIGDPAVRHRGTLGGSLANNDPSADYPAAALALGAVIMTDRREIAAEAFFQGMFATALEEGEIVVRVRFPVPAKAAYRKFRNPASRYPMAGVFVAVAAGGEIRVAVTGAAQGGVYRAADMEEALKGRFSPEAVAAIRPDAGLMLSDIHGSAEYRANLVSVMAKRAVAAIA